MKEKIKLDLLNYGQYLKIPEILRLQKCLSQPAHPDEMQFIIVHQVFELWFKLILQELDQAFNAMQSGDQKRLSAAIHSLRRVHAIQDLLIQQVHILETMRPVDFLYFRKKLNPASGFQSTQFREIEFFSGLKSPALLELCSGDAELVERAKKRYESPTLWDGFCTALSRNGISLGLDAKDNMVELRRLYKSPLEFPVLYELAECLVEYDEKLQLWRQHHVLMVERMIGGKMGTGAAVNQGMDGAKYLRTTLSKKCFPDLWEVRSEM